MQDIFLNGPLGKTELCVKQFMKRYDHCLRSKAKDLGMT